MKNPKMEPRFKGKSFSMKGSIKKSGKVIEFRKKEESSYNLFHQTKLNC